MTGTHLQDGQSGPPTAKSTRSYWHKDPSRGLLGHRTTDELPPAAEVVVVGTGITGTFAARELLAGGRDVVHVEAREACWGATGRNGGHCQPMLYKSKPSVARFELGTYIFLRDLIATNQIPCDWRTVGGVHAMFDEEALEATEKIIERLRRQEPDLAEKVTLVKDHQGLRILRVPWARGAVYQPNAAKLWPYKLVAWVLESLLRDYPASRYNLQTNTPVEHLQHAPGDGWIVHTSRGQIVARDVLLACNGYTSYLLPKMTGVLTPIRGQIAGLVPPGGYVPLEHTHVWMRDNGDDDYLIQRDEDGILILGGERLGAPGAEEGVWDDGQVNSTIGEKLRGGLRNTVKLRGPGQEEDKETQLHAKYEWTGIMGYSKDRNPWVGRVPVALGGKKDDDDDDGRGRGHLWISAGYSGHGMPSAARCGMRVANMMLGKAETFDMPDEYIASEERVRRVMDMDVGPRRNLLDDLKALLE
ncbi:hypothetical protein E4U42_005433 [Claviceps africana]|uniref:FAD dependent oxidoreductase domain-containing protein n=1 Tax=Claviceps africana TaxID=83212 RepID=A0A8K0J3W7_9HYPO|nr:hypothetical protein E4U42_005433 [Claviceps africana]